MLPALGFALFSSTGRDDSHITYWAAHALSTWGEIVNYNGERLEQSSSLLHTVVLAGLHLVTRLPVPVIGFLLGIAMGAATVVLTGLTAERIRPGSGWIAALLVATNPFLVYWSFGGLETSLAAATTAAFVCACAVFTRRGSRRAFGVAAAAIVAVVAVRPETGTIVTCAMLALAGWTLLRIDRRRCAGRVALLAAISAAAFGAIVAWRLAYFGVPFPQPVLAKIGGTRASDGLACAPEEDQVISSRPAVIERPVEDSFRVRERGRRHHGGDADDHLRARTARSATRFMRRMQMETSGVATLFVPMLKSGGARHNAKRSCRTSNE